MQYVRHYRYLALLCVLLLAACDFTESPNAPTVEVSPATVGDSAEGVTLILGQDQSDVTVSLDATVTGFGSEQLTYTWNVTQGEAKNVTFGSRDQEDTDVTFSALGTYTLTLNVSDGSKEDEGSVTVEVKARGDAGDGGTGGGSGGENESTLSVTTTSEAASLEDECTLRAAITAANTDEAVGGCPAGSGADTIVLAEGATYTLSEVDNGAEDEAGPSGLPRITSDIEIKGNGATIERAEGAPAFRLIYVAEGANLSAEDVTLQKGGQDQGAGGETAFENDGGGLFNAGTTSITNGTIRDNLIGLGGAAGIYNTGELSLKESSVSENEYFDGTAGVTNTEDGTLTLVSSNIDDNDGLGLRNSGEASLEQSSISGNGSISEGGVSNDGVFTAVDSDILNNASDGDSFSNEGVARFERVNYSSSAGLDNAENGELTVLDSTLALIDGPSPGTLDNSGQLKIINSTVSTEAERATSLQQEITSRSGTLEIRHSTLVNSPLEIREGSEVILASSLLADTLGEGAARENCQGETGAISSQGYNLNSDGSCNLSAEGDLSGVDPQLGELQDNGGPTLTHALQEGSPALDAVPTSACEVETDQRGVERPQGDACDIGAFEREQ